MRNAGPSLLPGSLQQIQAVLFDRLAQHSETPGLEAQVLLAHVLGQPRAWVLAHPEAELDLNTSATLAELLKRRESGEPLPYILGRWEFFGLDFIVNSAVLIPRQETELLVELALAWLNRVDKKVSNSLSIADIGTGSGCIAISLAVHAPGHPIVAIDISRSALEVTRANILMHKKRGQIQLVQGDLLQPFASLSFDLICANLPYIPSQALPELAIFGKEPSLALDGGPDGLRLIQQLLLQARQVLSPGGLVLLEIEASQGQAAQNLAKNIFPLAVISLHQDLAGKDRLIAIQNGTNVHLPV